MLRFPFRRPLVMLVACILAIGVMVPVTTLAGSGSVVHAQATAPSGLVTLHGNVPPQVADAHLLGHHQSSQGEQLTIELVLAMNHQDQMNALMSELHDPHSPQYRHWLSTGEF